LSLSPLDTLPDSLWLKRFVLDESQESLPPIARAMKNMLDNDMLVWNSDIQDESAWPHFINQYRMTQNETFLRNLHGNGKRQAPSKHTSDARKTNIKTIDTRSKTKIDPRSIKNKRILSSTYRTTNPSEKQQQHIPDIPQPKDQQSAQKPPVLKHKQKLKKKG
jgi:hypothetical protein